MFRGRGLKFNFVRKIIFSGKSIAQKGFSPLNLFFHSQSDQQHSRLSKLNLTALFFLQLKMV